MKLETTEDILKIMNGSIISAVVNTAMELGVFWLLVDKPLPATDVAQSLNIPLNRCSHWLQILCELGLLDHNAKGYAPSTVSRKAILDAQSQDTWAFQAREDRDSSFFVQDLALNISQPMPTWKPRSQTSPGYFQQIQEDPSYAARFTRKLYEIHHSLAEQLSDMLDLRGVQSMLDLGGGSGVVSFALLRKKKDLTSIVVDNDNVCQVGRELAVQNKLDKRITYLPADFFQDELPTGFDMVMLCDISSFSEILFRKIYNLLNLNGHLVIVDKFAPSSTSVPPSRLLSAFLDSLVNPAQSVDFTTLEMVQTQLQQAGFRSFSASSVAHKDNLPWDLDWTMLEARK